LHTLPILVSGRDSAIESCLLVANLNTFVLDFVARQKLEGTHITRRLLQELPLLPDEAYDRHFGERSARNLIVDSVLRISYTSFDLESFARNLRYEKEPFLWDETERSHLKARLDALFFHLYGITDEADVRYILSTFPTVERQDREAHDCYLSAEMIVWYMRALAANDVESSAPIDALVRQARHKEAA
jgi:hypothetical protein